MTHHALSLDPRNDYRFTYMGPKGTFTPLHRDVYGSYSWSSNIIGRKRWWLIPPAIKHRFHKHAGPHGPGEAEMLFDLRELSDPEALNGVMIIEQAPGETIHVPSGWYHQVENLEFCISINHNYANSHIIRNIYDNLLASLRRVEESIADILPLLKQRLGSEKAFSFTDGESREDIFCWEVEWVDEVQKVLEMDAGWALAVFWDMVLYNLEVSDRSSPPAPPELRPADDYVASQILPIIYDYKNRREWKVLGDTRATVLKAEAIVIAMQNDV
ncbi:hypothetical protein FFLO_05021 [Filobasidium floriforme]|uniref:JmjC domain-containing protein n=1 Tax=Filobasidium floriforme TaxID=5210 RepID=A0A8K0JJW1_9TREE|nr:hypothetical protein FFLO_05021 [Filobasidium floriforme]